MSQRHFFIIVSLSIPAINIMFVLSVAVLTSSYMAKISVDDSLQHVAKFSHPASAPSYAKIAHPWKLETEDSIRFGDDLGLYGHNSRFSNFKLSRF